jgi:hypothetical protein
MSTFERKVGDLLRGYGEGLEMTTQDINRLEQELEQKRAANQAQSKGRRNRIFQAAVAACAVTGVVLGALALRSGPTPTPAPGATPTASSDLAPTPTMTDLAGMWRQEPPPGDTPNGWLWTFTTKGLAIDALPDRVLSLMLEPTHKLARVPGGFTVTDVDAPACTTTFATSITPEGSMTATVTSSAATSGRLCNLSKGDSFNFIRVSPVSPIGANSASLWPSRPRTPVALLVQLKGTWVLAGTGKVMVVTGAGTFEIQDLGASDAKQSGKVTVGKDGEVTFISTDNPTCPAVYGHVTTTYNTVDTLLKDGSCARLNRLNDGWLRLN